MPDQEFSEVELSEIEWREYKTSVWLLRFLIRS